MGFDEANIILDNHTGACFIGQTIHGRLVFTEGEAKTIHGISVDFKGFCKVHWMSYRKRKRNNTSVSHVVYHDSYEEYFRQKTYVFGDADGEYHLNPGHHEFKFEFSVPRDCPGSLEGSDGHIRYRIKAVMLTSGIFSSNIEKMLPVRVIAPIDLNQLPQAKEPIELELSQSFCCWCISAGSSEIQVNVPVAGFCPGQVIPLEVTCVNRSSVDINEIKFSLRKNTNFIAVKARGERTHYETLHKVTKGPVPGGSTRNWTVELEIPEMEIVNLSNCQYIEVLTFLRVSTDVSRCHKDGEECYPVILGSIPLAGYQDNAKNTTQDNMPQAPTQNLQNVYPPPPIINQPTSNQYPGNQLNGQYPNQPYPSNTPYGSPNNGSYPVPPTGSPFPGGPPTGSPYPVAPGIPPTSPYPATNLPYPSGLIGFTALHGDGKPQESMPLLPQGANVPYPPTPYSASAPVPSTPGSDIKIPDVELDNPPYNPDYQEEKKQEKKEEKKQEKKE